MSTRAQLLSSLTQRMGDNSIFWTAAEKGYALNEALAVWQLVTGSRLVKRSVVVSVGSNYVPVPKQLVTVLRVRYLGAPLQQSSLPEMDMLTPGWELAPSGTPVRWAPVGINLVALDCPPGVSGAVEFLGLAQGERPAGDGEEVDIEEEDINVLLQFAQHYLAFKEGQGELDNTAPLFSALLEAAKEGNSRTGAEAIFAPFLGLPQDRKLRSAGAAKPGVR